MPGVQAAPPPPHRGASAPRVGGRFDLARREVLAHPVYPTAPGACRSPRTSCGRSFLSRSRCSADGRAARTRHSVLRGGPRPPPPASRWRGHGRRSAQIAPPRGCDSVRQRPRHLAFPGRVDDWEARVKRFYATVWRVAARGLDRPSGCPRIKRRPGVLSHPVTLSPAGSVALITSDTSAARTPTQKTRSCHHDQGNQGRLA